ncbi:MAG: serine/threonine protein kinase [Myxococcales bacterium]|nr:serine/threonine protein kinase [Myxococcales bacterium]
MDQDDGVDTVVNTANPTDERPSLPPAAIGLTPIAQRYKLGEQLGKGGMGEVLDAIDEQIGREVAIKRMRAEAPSEKQIARFMREARIQGRLEHPAVVPVHELGRDAEGKPYFAMKKLKGTTLAEILKAENTAKYPFQRQLRALADVCLAVELAHTRGFVHRDLKPDNIMLGDFGETYVLDWGVAKVTGEDDSALVASEEPGQGLVTAAGAAVGTPGYMAPEQARGLADIDARADVYSLGCVLFELLTHDRLHPGGQAGMQSAVAGIDSRPSHRTPDREIPPELDNLTVRATTPAREQRIATARELGERIQMFLDGDRDTELRRTLAKQHLENALSAFAEEDRSAAMREAGRALALDPTLHRAGELITRMMLEPPTTLPPEVVKQFDSDSADIVRRTSGAAAVATGNYLLFAPLLALVGGGARLTELLLMVALSGMAVLFLLWMRRPGRPFLAAPVIIIHVALIAVVGRLYTPFLLAPGIAAVTAMGFMTGPQYAKRQATWVATVCLIGVALPFVGEQLGWLPPSFTVSAEHGFAMIVSPMFQGTTSTVVLMFLYAAAIIGACVVMTRGLKNAERRARAHMHLQAWQLRQLVAQPGT